jgi:hypothetical protein
MGDRHPPTHRFFMSFKQGIVAFSLMAIGFSLPLILSIDLPAYAQERDRTQNRDRSPEEESKPRRRIIRRIKAPSKPLIPQNRDDRGTSRLRPPMPDLVRPEESISDLDRAIQISPYDATLYISRGRLKYEQSQRYAAIADIKLAAQIYQRAGNRKGYESAIGLLSKWGVRETPSDALEPR